jgi:hypothetical protein
MGRGRALLFRRMGAQREKRLPVCPRTEGGLFLTKCGLRPEAGSRRARIFFCSMPLEAFDCLRNLEGKEMAIKEVS